MKYILVFALFAATPQSWAFKLSPMVSEFSPSGQGKTLSFFLENPTDKKMAIQIQIFEREISPKGEEMRTETNLFTLYPPQVVLMPKQKRTVRVNWKGPEKLEKEQSFRLVAEELPVDLEDKKAESRTQLNFLLKYVASIYVKPQGAAPKVSVKSAKLLEQKKGEPLFWELVLQNEGNAHQVLSNIEIKIKIKDATTKLEISEKEALAAENILANSTRRFILPWPKKLKPENFETLIQFEAIESQ